tara:strand:- start:416 stop:616 length:201 start_codon:yes stop_codon:yes gene_type:complete
MANAVISTAEHRAILDTYWEQIEFGSQPESAMNLATIVYQQRHPAVPVDEARAVVGDLLESTQLVS